MAALANLLRRLRRPTPDPQTLERIKSSVRELMALPADTAIAVNEIACLDPACPGLETVILVMEPGRKTRAYKVAKALDAVTEQDLREALV